MCVTAHCAAGGQSHKCFHTNEAVRHRAEQQGHLGLGVQGLLALLWLLLPSILHRHVRGHKERHAGGHCPLGHVPHKAIAGRSSLQYRMKSASTACKVQKSAARNGVASVLTCTGVSRQNRAAQRWGVARYWRGTESTGSRQP